MPSPNPWMLLVRTALIAGQWVRTRAFVASPAMWRVALLAAAVAAVGAGIAWQLEGLHPIPFAAAAACAAVLTIPVWGWRQLVRPSAIPVVVLARFEGENLAYEEIATVHVREVERRLRRNDALMRAIEVRVVKAPIREQHARRVMHHTEAIAVVSGNGLVIADHARWEGWFLTAWPMLSFRTIRNERTGEQAVIDEELSVSEVERTDFPTDSQQPTITLTSEIFSADHAAAVEATLLVCARVWSPVPDQDAALFAASDVLREHMPAKVRAAHEIGKLSSLLEDDPVSLVQALEAVGDAEAPHELLFNTCFMLMTENPHRFDHHDRLRIAKKAVLAAPDDVTANANAGLTLLWIGRLDEARAYLTHAYRSRRGDEPSNLEAMLVAHLFKVGGTTGDWDCWLRKLDKLTAWNRAGVLAQIELEAHELTAGAPPEHFGAGIGYIRREDH